jgi:hypothetical protein
MLVWADEILTHSRVWVFVGYSFPQYDDDVMSMLEWALWDGTQHHDIFVVAPDAEDIVSRVQMRLKGWDARARWYPWSGTFTAFTSHISSDMARVYASRIRRYAPPGRPSRRRG